MLTGKDVKVKGRFCNGESLTQSIEYEGLSLPRIGSVYTWFFLYSSGRKVLQFTNLNRCIDPWGMCWFFIIAWGIALSGWNIGIQVWLPLSMAEVDHAHILGEMAQRHQLAVSQGKLKLVLSVYFLILDHSVSEKRHSKMWMSPSLQTIGVGGFPPITSALM